MSRRKTLRVPSDREHRVVPERFFGVFPAARWRPVCSRCGEHLGGSLKGDSQ